MNGDAKLVLVLDVRWDVASDYFLKESEFFGHGSKLALEDYK